MSLTIRGKREVQGGSAAAIKQARLLADYKVTSTFTHEQKDHLLAFGRALHPLQDSWSHQGVPGVPWGCDPLIAWAHSDNRGGWKSHDADHTHRWPKDILEAARATYELLQDFLKRNPWSGSGSPRLWKTIEADIDAFSGAKTKTEKAAWFKSRKLPETTFLSSITLTDGTEAFIPWFLQRVFPMLQLRIDVPSEVSTLFDKFLSQWVTSTDYERLVSDYVDISRVAASAGLKKFGDDKSVALTMLRMWQMRDHGRVTALGHGDSNSKEGVGQFKDLAASVANPANHIKFKTLGEAMVPFGSPTGPRFIVVRPEGAPYSALFQFRHTRYDVLVVGADRVGARWRIVSVGWAVEH